MQPYKGTKPVIAIDANIHVAYGYLLTCIVSHQVGNRPGRFEPRKKKRPFKLYDFVNKPRHEAKLDMINGFCNN